MIDKEIGEIRRHLRRERSNITAIYGCYVNENKEIISKFRQSTGMMPENESDKYFALLRRTLSGSLGKNLIDITFKTSQVAGSPEHQLLMDLRKSQLKDEEKLQKLISEIEGAGRVKVMITLEASDENVFAYNRDESYRENEQKFSSDYILIKNDGEETGLKLKTVYPKVKGVAVVCDGAHNPITKEHIISVISALFDISTKNISVVSTG